MKSTFCLISFFFLPSILLAQTPIDVAENTLKIGGLKDEVFYYGFAEGDKLIFSFEEVDGKELKEVEITEMPSSTKFMDYKTSKIESKTIQVVKTNIYRFRLSNGNVKGRICKVKIQRIPASDATKNFNTSVATKIVNDTNYVVMDERYLISRDTAVHNLTDRVTKVNSNTNLMNDNTTYFNFTLPANTVAWSYYVGVDQTGQEAFAEATNKMAKTAAPIAARIPGYGPLAALIITGSSFIPLMEKGEDVEYYIVDHNNIQLLKNGQAFNYVKKGKVINDFSKVDYLGSGLFYFWLKNDNTFFAIDVTVKVTAVTITENWGTRQVEVMKLKPREEMYILD